MKILFQDNTNPFFNLATEEFLLKQKKEDFTLLYVNQPAVIVGKHQNSIAEINNFAIEKFKIPVIRRISGGGTVYHDLQNLNFAFLLSVDKNPVNFRKYSLPIVDYLNKIGVKANFSPRNDIFIANKKISGNAEHIFKNRVLHHGTLLFKSDLKFLNKVIDTHHERYQSKAVQSVRREVDNIQNYVPNEMDFDFFCNDLKSFLQKANNLSTYTLNPSDKKEINKLIKNKYETPEWNFGYSPKYTFKNSFIFKDEEIKVQFQVIKGKIEFITLNNIQNSDLFYSLHKLKGEWHLPQYINNQLITNFDKNTTSFLVDHLV